MTISEQLESILTTKNNLKSTLEDNDIVAPQLFSNYPNSFKELIDSYKDILIYMDTIIVNAETSVTQLNALFNALKDSTSYTRSVQVVRCTSTTYGGANVRSAAASGDNIIAAMKTGDISEYLGVSGNYNIINSYRYGSTYNSITTPLKLYTEVAYISKDTSYSVVEDGTLQLKRIDISKCSANVQKLCNYTLAQEKGFEVVFSIVSDSGTDSGGETIEPTSHQDEFVFNDCYTDNYSNSTYTTKAGSNSSYVRQGYWSGYYWYKGNLRFTSSRLTELQNILTKSNVESMEIYLQRVNSSHGAATGTVSLYACSSTGKVSDASISGMGTLARGANTGWVKLPDDITQGFINGDYDHFEVYKNSSSTSYYILYENCKLRVNYTA